MISFSRIRYVCNKLICRINANAYMSYKPLSGCLAAHGSAITAQQM